MAQSVNGGEVGDGGQGREVIVMVIEGAEELRTVVDALQLRKRTSGVGTPEHERCNRVLERLLTEAEKKVDAMMTSARRDPKAR